jgi:hypothetical protein
MAKKNKKVQTKEEYLNWAFLQLAKAFEVPESFAKEHLPFPEKKEKRVYSVYIKSHTDLPDFDQTIEAENVIDALRQLRGWLTDWDDLDILKEIEFPMDNLAEEDKVILRLLNEINDLETAKSELEEEKYQIRREAEELAIKLRS